VAASRITAGSYPRWTLKVRPMIALGLCDDQDGAAALVIDDVLWGVLSQAEVDRQPRNVVLPSGAMDALLSDAGLHAQDVDRVVFGGAMTPNTIRRLRSTSITGVSPQHASLARSVLRRTGLHMLDADLARSILGRRLASHGLTRAHVELEEIHSALAYAAYATQADVDALVLVAHPRGDGLALSAWTGEAGQLDCLSNQSELALVARAASFVAAEVGMDRWRADLARKGPTPDPRVIEALEGRLGFRNGAFPRARLGRSERATDPFWRELRELSPWEGIARALADVVAEGLVVWAESWVRRTAKSAVAVAGDLFDDGPLLAGLGGIPAVQSVWLVPGGAARGRAMGAVLGTVGASPQAFGTPFLGIDWSDDACTKALAGRKATKPRSLARSVAELLGSGASVGVFRGRGEMTEHPVGNRVVATASEHPAAGAVVLRDNANALPGALRALARFASWPNPSGERPLVTDDAFWTKVVEAVPGSTVRLSPLLDKGGVTVFSPEEAIDAFESRHLDALVLNDRLVRRG
jgi:predicted NodU family carbamoyl transferase